MQDEYIDNKRHDNTCLDCGVTYASEDLIEIGEDRYICGDCEQTRKSIGLPVQEIPLESKEYVPKELF